MVAETKFSVQPAVLMKLKPLSLLAALLWLAGSAFASNFIAPDVIDPAKLLPPAPTPDSLIQHAEIEVLLLLQTDRTPAQIARARLVDGEDAFIFGSGVLGPWFTAANLPQTAAFFAQVADDLGPINRATKTSFNRRRPPFQDARIKPCVKVPDSSSYPSGHAFRSAIWSGLLGAAFPDQADALAQRAAETRWCRLLAGVHHPSDVEAGRILGEAIARELLKSPGVQKAIEELRSEAASHQQKKAA
jgi:acid phosphatase (class A)